MKEVPGTPQKLRAMIQVCMVHLLNRMQDETSEMALEPFFELQTLLKDYAGYKKDDVPLCLLVSIISIQMLTSTLCPQSIQQQKAWNVRRALEKIFELNLQKKCPRRCNLCRNMYLYVLMLNRANDGIMKKNMSPMIYDVEEFEKAGTCMSSVMYASYLIQHGHPAEALQKLPPTETVTTDMIFRLDPCPKVLPPDRLGAKPFCFMLQKTMVTVVTGALPHCPQVWTGILQQLCSVDVKMVCIVHYLQALACHHLKDRAGCVAAAKKIAETQKTPTCYFYDQTLCCECAPVSWACYVHG